MLDENKKLVSTPFHFYADPAGRLTVSCFELSPEDIQRVIETGKIWVTAPFKSFPPLSLQTETPFTPKTLTDEKENNQSSGNDQQHNDGNHKLTFERGTQREPD